MIKMITSRSDLYRRLWEEYFPLPNNQKHKCFFYRYLKNKKDLQADRIAESTDSLEKYYSSRNKRDKYLLLRSAYLAYTNKLLAEEEYIERFTQLVGTKESKKYEPFTSDLINEAELYYEKKFLLGCIKDFFYNLGYRVRDNAKKNIVIDELGYAKTEERYLKEQDGYIDDLDLWAHYYNSFATNQNDLPAQSVSDINEEYIKQCSELFSLLKRENSDKVFVPLYFDPRSGAGVIIIGSNKLPQKKKNGKSCRIGIIYLSEILGDQMSDFGELEISIKIDDCDFYDNVSEAFAKFRIGISYQTYYANYRDHNEEPPEGINSIFRNYFLIDENIPADSENLTKQFIAKEKLDIQEHIAQKQNRIQRLSQKS